MEAVVLGSLLVSAVAAAAALLVAFRAQGVTVVVESSPSEQGPFRAEGSMTEADAVWLSRVAESWSPLTEAEKLFLEALSEEDSSGEEEK